MIGWILLIGGVALAGWFTSYPVIWLATWRMDGKRDLTSNGPASKYQWIAALLLGVTYFLVIGFAADWDFGTSE